MGNAARQFAELTPEEGQIERCAVEGDDQLVGAQTIHELIQIVPPNERVKSGVVENADHRGVCIVRGQAGRFDVQERGVIDEVGVQPPSFGTWETLREPVRFPATQPRGGFFEFGYLLGAGLPGPGELIPGGDALFPPGLFGDPADAGEVQERMG